MELVQAIAAAGKLLVLAGATLAVGASLVPKAFVELVRARQLTLGECIVVASGSGIALVTLLGLALGYAGAFSLALVVALLAAIAAWRHRRLWWLRRSAQGLRLQRFEIFSAAIAVAIVAYAIVWRSHEIQGLRDQGVYCATGIELARTGDIGWRDRLIEQAGFERVRHLFEDLGDLLRGRPRYLRFAGFYLADPPGSKVVPQFLHGYEVWMALAYLVGGPQATQCVNGIFVGLGLLAFACVARRLWGSLSASLALVLLATSIAQLWYARFPSNEPLIQALVWCFLLVMTLGRMFSAEMTTANRTAASSLLGAAFLPLAAATVVKFAFWPLLAIVAFELGLAAGEHSLRVRMRTLLSFLAIVAGGAYLHAALFANFYLYGSWLFSVSRFGISFEMFPVLFVGGVLACCSLGVLVADSLDPLRRAWARVRKPVAVAAVVLCSAVLVYQRQVWASPQLASDVWSERTNLYEFAQYYGFAYMAAALVGVAMWMALDSRRPGRRIVYLLALAAAFFLVRRNLDALHPWASRRWLPILVPVTALAAATPLAILAERGSAGKRLAVGVGLTILVATQLWRGHVLLTTPNYRGAIPQVDRWASHLTASDLVLLEPSAVVAQYGPYLAARFDIQGYVQPNTPEGWAKTKALVLSGPFASRRVVYVTDEVLTEPTVTSSFARTVATERLDYPVVREELRRLPTRATQIRETIRVYELDLAQMPAGWWTRWKPPLVTSPRQPPLVLSMGPDAEPYLLSGFFAPTPQGDGTAFRWTDGNARVAFGRLVAPTTSSRRLTLSARIHSGRPEQSVDVHWYLDLDKPGRARKLGVTKAQPAWTTCTVDLEASWISPESVLELQSLRPPIPSDRIPAGQLGVRVLDLKVE